MNYSSILRSELIKIRSIRIYALTVFLGILGLSASALGMSITGFGGGPSGLIALCLEYMVYMLLVLGALVSTGDYRAGTAGVTASLVPSWRSVVVAKFILVFLLALVIACAALFGVVLGAAWGSEISPVATAEEVGWDVLAADTLAGPLAAGMGVAIGELLRSPAAAMITALFWAFIAETALIFMLSIQISAYLPFKTIGMSRTTVGMLGPVPGLCIFALYTVALIVLALISAQKRPVPGE